MKALATPHRALGRASRPRGFASALQPVGRFTLHLVEMCMVMCAGAMALSVLFFGAAGLLGYSDLLETAPELSVMVIAVNLSVPMAAWMRFRGMAWRPTMEMSGSTMVVGLMLIGAYWLDLVAKGRLVEIQTAVACPLMLGVMLFRPRLYAGHHTDHQHTAHHPDGGNPARRDGPLPRSLARANRRYANPVIRRFAGSFGPLTLVRHHGRRTGRAYATPVMSFAIDDGLVIGVIYGSSSDWVHNVLASGGAEVKRRGQTRQYGGARLVERDEGLRLVPQWVRGPLRVLGVHHFISLTNEGGESHDRSETA
jgi:deazaflavin-dependent oxidoreductase (nitroreductase family)